MTTPCPNCGVEILTPDEMDDLAGYPLDHKLMDRFRPRVNRPVALTLEEAKSLVGVGGLPYWLEQRIKEASGG